MVPIGRNTLAKQMHSVASIAFLDGKFTNSSGSKTVIQTLRDNFDPMEILELTGHATPESAMTAIILWKNSGDFRKKFAGFNTSTTTTNSYSSQALRKIVLKSSTPPSNTAATSNRDSISDSWSSYLMSGTVGGCLLD